MNIATWNMQGSNASTENKWNTQVKNAIAQLGLDVFCLQECGLVPLSAHHEVVWSMNNVGLATWLMPFIGAAPTFRNALGVAVVPGPLVLNGTNLYASTAQGFEIGYYTWGTATIIFIFFS